MSVVGGFGPSIVGANMRRWDAGTLAWVSWDGSLQTGALTIGNVGVTSSVLPTGAATSALQTTGNTSLADLFTHFSDSSAIDAFGRLRIASISTRFDSKQIFSNEPLFWDDIEASGGGTSSTWSADTASSVLGVGATTAGVRVRQTFMRHNYQPGKSQLFLGTGCLRFSGGGTGITARIGLFDANNGLFFENAEGTVRIVRRTHVTGSPVDNATTQASWNIDPMDGTGPSGVTVDWTKAQLFWIDFEWLGSGRVRFGLVLGGLVRYVHEMNHANSLTGVYMSTPNLPVRYEITNDGNGVASSMTHTCSTVSSEAGQEPFGVLQYHTTATHVDADVAETLYAVLGIRLKSTHFGCTIDVLDATVLCMTNDDYEWQIILNPTVAGTFTYGDKTNAAVQTAVGATANTVTNGTVIAGGHINAGLPLTANINNARRLGSTIAGVADTLVLCVRPHTANADVHGSLSWRELL